jgi:hypothetical protein
MNALKKVSVSCLALVAALLAAAAPAAARDGGSYGYIRIVEGSATVIQSGSGEPSDAEVNLPVLAGDRIQVPARSRLELVLADRNLVRVDGGSELLLERLAASPDTDDRATVLRLLEGNLQLIVTQESEGEELPRVETPNATVYVQSFGVYRVTAESGGWSELVVRRGTAEVVTEGGSQIVRADEELVIEGDRYADGVRQAGGYDTLERWATKLDEDYASADVRYVDDDLRYAAAPLARHGSWVQVNNQSYWRPRVDSGWRPYSHGRWVYTPSGMTWVSYEPWGWVPYHYGSWDYLPAHGWLWQPGYVYSPAWVYWYWGADHVGWCPTGYYTRYYGSRFGLDFGFRQGVYGWAGGSWDHFSHWTFVSGGYFDGYRNGYRRGYRDGYRDGNWDVRRYAVPVDRLRSRFAQLDRGLITTDTRSLRPGSFKDPADALRVLRDQRNGRGATELPDVSSFMARKPDLSPTLSRWVRADGNQAQLDGSPLKPGTLGRLRNEKPNRGDEPGRTGSGKPWVVLGDDRPGSSRGGDPPATRQPTLRGTTPEQRPSAGAPSNPSGDTPTGKPSLRDRLNRPEPGSDGGAPRPDRPTIRPDRREIPATGGDRPVVIPRQRDNGDTRDGDSDDRGSRPRPEIDRRSLPRVQPPSSSPSRPTTDREDRGTSLRPERPRSSDDGDRPEPRMSTSPRVRDTDRESERERPTYSRPEPRVRPSSPEPDRRPSYSRPEAERPSYSRPERESARSEVRPSPTPPSSRSTPRSSEPSSKPAPETRERSRPSPPPSASSSGRSDRSSRSSRESKPPRSSRGDGRDN